MNDQSNKTHCSISQSEKQKVEGVGGGEVYICSLGILFISQRHPDPLDVAAEFRLVVNFVGGLPTHPPLFLITLKH